jgi:signal transduction histidine kinase
VNGLPFDVEIAAIPFPRESEMAAQIIFRDISVRKKSEEALKHAYIELKETQEALINSEKLAALGRFAAGVAHEIRNPLANISASAQLLMNNYQVSDEMRRYLEVILRNTDTANQIIKELLDFTSTKEISLAKENINNVIISICDLIKSRCIASNIHLIKDIKEVPDTYINFKKLEQAMLNFASNAIEAMPGGGKLTFRNYYDIKPNEIVIQIADTGHGIEEANIDKVFEPFFTTKDNGTGLGMSLAYHIIKAHKGKLHLESEKDKGTTINISIPVLTH